MQLGSGSPLKPPFPFSLPTNTNQRIRIEPIKIFLNIIFCSFFKQKYRIEHFKDKGNKFDYFSHQFSLTYSVIVDN